MKNCCCSVSVLFLILILILACRLKTAFVERRQENVVASGRYSQTNGRRERCRVCNTGVQHNDTELFSVVLIVVAAATTAVFFAENGRETDCAHSAPIFLKKKRIVSQIDNSLELPPTRRRRCQRVRIQRAPPTASNDHDDETVQKIKN